MSQKRKKRFRKQLETIRDSTKMVEKKNLDFWKIIKESWLFLSLVSVVTVGIYFNGMGADFVSDDYATILNNPEIATWKYGLQNGATTYFMNTLTAKLFGVYKEPYHIVSLLFFIVIIWTSFVFVYHLFGKVVAYFSIALFAVHPVHVESVTWISGKPYLIIAFYVILAMIFFIKFLEKENLWYLLAAMGSFVLGFVSDNPRPFSFFMIIVLYLILRSINITKLKIFKYWPLVALVLLVVSVVAWPHITSRVNVVNSGYNSTESIFYNPLFQYPTGLSKYFQLFFLPFDLTLYHTLFVFPVWLNWAIFLTYTGLLIYFFVKDKRYFFSLAFIFVSILPSMMPVKVSWLVAERYGFLASLGWCMFVSLILEDIYYYKNWLAAAILAPMIVFYGIRVALRNIDWQTNHNLWVNTCQVSPNSHNAWNNIGDDYDKLKQYDNAIKGFTQSTLIKPNYADAYHNRANIFYKIGRFDMARDSYMTALHFSPGLYQTYLSLINIDILEKRLDLALEHASKSLELQPSNPQAAYVLAVVRIQRGELKEGQEILESIVRQVPEFTQAKELLIQLKTGAIK